MAYKLKKSGQIVHVYRSDKDHPNGKTTSLRRAVVGRKGQIFDTLAPDVVEAIEAGELDDVWEALGEPSDDAETTPVTDAGTEGSAPASEAGQDDVPDGGAADEIDRSRPDPAPAFPGDEAPIEDDGGGQEGDQDSNSSPEDGGQEGHGHETDETHEHETNYEELGNDRLEQIVKMHEGLVVKGTGAQGKQKKSDYVNALVAWHGQG